MLSALIGNFNYVISQVDTEDQAFAAHHKFSQELFDIVRNFRYDIDAFLFFLLSIILTFWITWL